MNLLIKGGVISLIIHLLIGGMIGIIVWNHCFNSDVIEIDLTQVDWHHERIGGREGKGVERANSPILNSRQDVITTKRKLIDEKVAVLATNDTQIVYRKSRHTPLESFDRSDTILSNESQSSVGSSGNGIGGASGTGIGSGAQGNNGRGAGNGTGEGGSGTKGGIKYYLSAHYSYIIARIQQHLIYPNQARMMGISGKAIYSFVIHQDGSIDALTLIKSAGLSALDEAGMRAIRRASPFPSPPAAARIKIPIVFSLH